MYVYMMRKCKLLPQASERAIALWGFKPFTVDGTYLVSLIFFHILWMVQTGNTILKVPCEVWEHNHLYYCCLLPPTMCYYIVDQLFFPSMG